MDSDTLRDPSYFAARPSRFVLFLRTFIPWQLFRFAWINLKMIDIISRSHGKRIRKTKGAG
ncbi:MAG: hypothetical protein K1X83_05220 [Oligoflexia bacterium]|nr:hypothetical protein [Oligoflexia bacterium]